MQTTEVNLVKELQLATRTNDNNVLALNDDALCLPLRISEFHSEKNLDAFIKNVEKLIHSSIEYRLWISYVLDVLGHNSCVLTHEKASECELQVHHHPINLYTITKCIVNDFLRQELKFNTFDISSKVIELHYQNKIGYMVLLSSLHEKFHNGFQKLPIDYVNGDYKYIISNYIIDEDQKQTIVDFCNTHICDCKIEWTKDSYPGLQEKVA